MKKIQTKKTAPKPKKKAKSVYPFKPLHAAIGVGVLTFLVFFPSIYNGFINWDDPTYITNNARIKNLSFSTILVMFKSYLLSNYHPLTELSYGIDYSLFGKGAKGFHTTNILLHTANSVLAFFFILRLTKGRVVAALFAATLFGIHPMRVESVAWIAERKDVLHVFFYLLALLQYLKYLDSGRIKKYLGFTAILFLCALLSKAQAVTFPIAMVLIDYFYDRKDLKSLALEKAPFFLLSLVFGIVAIMAQTASAAVSMVDIPVWQRAFTASFALFTYLWMSIVPVGQSAIHPYPFEMGGELPIYMYASILVMIGFLAAIFIGFKKNQKELVFGLGFFFFAILPMLQFLTVGEAIIAERYSYLPYLGLFFLFGYLLDRTFIQQEKNKNILLVAAAVICLVYSFFTVGMIAVWKDSETLWTNAVETHPNAQMAYGNLGQFYNKKDFAKAIQVADKGIQVAPDFYRNYVNKGYALFKQNKHQEAVPVLEEGLKRKANDFEGNYYLGICYETLKNWDKAIEHYSNTISLLDGHVEARIQRGAININHKNKPAKAIEDFKRVTVLYPKHVKAYEFLGTGYYKNKQYPEALTALNKSISLNGQSGQAYYIRALTHVGMKNYIGAVADGRQARKLGANVSEATISSWEAKIKQ